LPHPRTSTEVGGGADLLTVSQVAARLRVKPVTVYRLCQRGELAHFGVSNAVRVEAAELERFLLSTRRNKG
jgi:excisionase family DNA binding protein